MSTVMKEAVNYGAKIAAIDEPLYDVWVWGHILELVLEDDGHELDMSRRKRDLVEGGIARVSDQLKKAIDALSQAYFGDEEEARS